MDMQRVQNPRWKQLRTEFLECHQKPLNVALHLLTTPLGIFSALALLHSCSPFLTVLVVMVYLAWLAVSIPLGLTLMSAAALGALLVGVHTIELATQFGFGLMVAAYLLQELAHKLTGEKTLQSGYMEKTSWLQHLLEHTLYLLPLVLASFWHCRGSVFGFLVPRNRVVTTELVEERHRRDIDAILDFVMSQNPSEDHTTHWWHRELPLALEQAFTRLAASEPMIDMFRRVHGRDVVVEVVKPMNEIYVAGPMKEISSDTVFKTPHIDGPWAVFPFASVYRCMLAISENKRVRTHFPLAGPDYHQPETVTLDKGNAVAFDYNREPHFISADPNIAQTCQRVSLKIHYLVYPRWWKMFGPILGRLSSRYNEEARQLFLNTLKPTGLLARLQAFMILLNTIVFESVQRFIGWGNFLYVGAAAGLALLTQNVALFLAATGFVHYGLYIGAFADRDNVAFGQFQRNAIFYKTVSLASLFGLLVYYGQFEPVSLSLTALGFGLSSLAFWRLGPVRTYFGAELGWCAYQQETRFPYGTIPHPMILGSVIGLFGLYCCEPIRLHFPWLIPLHLAFYFLHLCQELNADERPID